MYLLLNCPKPVNKIRETYFVENCSLLFWKCIELMLALCTWSAMVGLSEQVNKHEVDMALVKVNLLITWFLHVRDFATHKLQVTSVNGFTYTSCTPVQV